MTRSFDFVYMDRTNPSYNLLAESKPKELFSDLSMIHLILNVDRSTPQNQRLPLSALQGGFEGHNVVDDAPLDELRDVPRTADIGARGSLDHGGSGIVPGPQKLMITIET